MFLDQHRENTASLSESERQTPAVARALDAIAPMRPARTRYLAFARDADRPAFARACWRWRQSGLAFAAEKRASSCG